MIRRLVLRRHLSLSGTREGIVFERLSQGDDGGLACEWIDSTADWTRYAVCLPAAWSVRPADLRRFAYDHEKVRSLIEACVEDNANWLVFEPLSRQVLGQAAQAIKAALHDLSSVFDVSNVTCEEGTLNAIAVQVEGNFKNGEQTAITFEMFLERATSAKS